MGEIAQIEPSYDDLAFEPEMTWEELVEKAKELGYVSHNARCLEKNDLFFSWDKQITFVRDINFIGIRVTIAENRTPAQMYQIMKALEN